MPRKEEFQEIIKMVKNNKALGEDNIGAKILKKGGELLLLMICRN